MKFISTRIGAFICAFFLCILLQILALTLKLGSSEDLLFKMFVLIPSFFLYRFLRGEYNPKIQQGKVFTYYDDGTRKEILNFKDDVKDGLCQSFYDNGQLRKKANYKLGKLNGELLIYDYNGQLTHKQNFNNGRFDGEITQYNLDGGIKFKENYIDGKKVV